MRNFNIRGSTNTSLLDLFWDHCRRTLALDSGVGSHHRRHTGVDVEITNNTSHTPSNLSLS